MTGWTNAIPVHLHCKAEGTLTANNLHSLHIQLPGWDMSTAKIHTSCLYLEIKKAAAIQIIKGL